MGSDPGSPPRTDAESQRALLNTTVCSAVADNLVHCTGAFVDADTLRVGSGTFVMIDGRLFVATAAHMIPTNPQGRLSFVRSTWHNIKESTVPIISFAKSQSGDAGYLELSPDIADVLGKVPITLDRISPRGTGEVGRLAFLVGFPGELIRKTAKPRSPDNGLLDCDFSMMFYTNVPAPPDEWQNSLDPPACDSRDIFLGYDQEADMWRFPGRTNRDGLANPEGTSGGGLWQGVDCEGDLWHADRVQLIGIQSSWHQQRKYIRGCQIHHWLRLLYEREPDLRGQLRAAFTGLFDDMPSSKPR